MSKKTTYAHDTILKYAGIKNSSPKFQDYEEEYEVYCDTEYSKVAYDDKA